MQPTFPVCIETSALHVGKNKIVYYPQIKPMQNEKVRMFINHTLLYETEQLIEKQKSDIPTEIVEMIGTYEVKNNQRDTLSILLSNYAYHFHAAHGMTYLRSLTFELQNGHIYSLKELFQPNSNYIEKLSRIVNDQIKKREIPTFDDKVTIQPNQDFYLADKVIVLYFQLYEITPYYYGIPMFPISIYELQDIIDENGPLGKNVLP